MERTANKFLPVLLFFSICLGFESLPALKWAKSLKEINISPLCLAEAPSGHIIAADSSKIIIMDAGSGKEMRTISGFSRINSIEPLAGGGFVISDLNKITVLDSSMEVQWSKPVMGEPNFILKSVNQTSDSGFIALAEIKNAVVMIIKCDRNGDTLWTRTKGDTTQMAVYKGAGVVEVDGVYIAGGEYCPGICKGLPGWITAYSPQGKEIWSKTRPGFGIYKLYPIQNSVLITGSTENGSSSFIDQQVSDDHLKKISWFPATDIFVVQIGNDGQVLFDTSYSFRTVNFGKSIQKAGDVLIVAGYAGVYEFMEGEREQVVFATDQRGMVLWKKEYRVITNSSAIAKLLSAGALVVATADSIYLYGSPAISGGRKNKWISPEMKIVQMGMNGRIAYTINHSSTVIINLLDLHGRKIRTLENRFMKAGVHCLNIDNCTPGSYLLEMCTGRSRTLSEKIIIGPGN